jgi:hypothetical protein
VAIVCHSPAALRQNPHSSGPTANALLAALKGKPIARAS